MRISSLTPAVFACAAAFAVGCAGPEQKLGRGINNVTEFTRLGEIRRSVEQTALWENHDTAYTAGLLQGINRSIVRTTVGAFEILTFPIPSYDPWLAPGNKLVNDATVDPTYPDAYKPHFLADPSSSPDSNLGWGGGDVLPFVAGSRFRIFDY